MEKKTVSEIMLTLLLITMLTLAFNLQPAGASETIYIRPDGSIDPPTAPILRDGDIYTFTDNIYDSIFVERSNIIIDGNGYTLQGPGSHGFFVRGTLLSNNVTIQNTNIKNFYRGVYLEGSSNNTIVGNNITNNDEGLVLESIPYPYLIASNNNVSSNNITNNNYNGILLYASSNNVLRNNIMAGNLYNFAVYDDVVSENFIQDADESNTVDGKPIYYLVNRRDMAVSSEAGYVALVNSTNITVEGLELKNNGQGILLVNTTDSQITSNNITNNEEGGVMLLGFCNNNTVSGNNIINNGESGGTRGGVVLKESCNNNTVSGNNITNSEEAGVFLVYSCSNNTVSGNNITDNDYHGVVLWNSCDNNTVSGNIITHNTQVGVTLFTSCDNNTVFGNNVTNNWRGVLLGDSADNRFYHNNFIDNTEQVDIGTPGYANVWDDGYPSGGNYWSDYIGVDSKSGPNQNEPGGDGIGDTPCVIDAQNQDNYPLMNPVYYVIIEAYCYVEGGPISVSITMDGSATGFDTPHTFTELWGSHTFTVPSTDANGHPFMKWSTSETSTTITINSGGTYTAYYQRSAVGGIASPVDNFGLLAPYIALAIAVVVITTGAVYAKKRWSSKAVVQRP